MSLRFERGDEHTPRGHAILYARLSGPVERYVATYCVTLPISFSLGKYLPPMFAGQLPPDALGDSGAMSAMPIPPMLEDVQSLDALIQMAEARDDDLCDIGTLLISDDSQRMTFAAQACADYGSGYAAYQARWPATVSSGGQAGGAARGGGASQPTGGQPDAAVVAASALPERDRLGEIARLIGQARYAIDGRDTHLLGDVSGQLHALAATLPDKYRADQLAEVALRPDDLGARLAELYLQRAYKMLDEDYISIPPIEQRIRELREQSGA